MARPLGGWCGGSCRSCTFRRLRRVLGSLECASRCLRGRRCFESSVTAWMPVRVEGVSESCVIRRVRMYWSREGGGKSQCVWRKFVCLSTQGKPLAHGPWNHIHASKFSIHRQAVAIYFTSAHRQVKHAEQIDSRHPLGSRFLPNALPGRPQAQARRGYRARPRPRIAPK